MSLEFLIHDVAGLEICMIESGKVVRPRLCEIVIVYQTISKLAGKEPVGYSMKISLHFDGMELREEKW